MEEQKKRTGHGQGPTIDFRLLWQNIRKHRKLYYQLLPLTFVVVYLIALGYPDYYRCKVTLVPESNANSGSLGTLSSLASSFGFNLGNGNNGSNADAITPKLYPDLMNSVDFTTALFDIKVKRDSDARAMTYYEYLRDCQKESWWKETRKGLMSLFSTPEERKREPVDLFRLTPEQKGITGLIKKNVVCMVDKKTDIISIDVTDQDPLVAATVADSVRSRLQETLTAYRTTKARHDLAYVRKLHQEAKRDYDRACDLYADFMDTNRDLVLESVRQKQTKLENEMQLRYNNYNALSAQLLAALAKVQEVTPAFTTLERATVPLVKDGPRRGRIVFACVSLVFILITLWVMLKEGQMKALFRGIN